MKGKVFLVGAGPGDYKLITLKGFECLQAADVIVYDRLISEKLLEYRKRNCELIYVGKQSSNHTKTQGEINEIICKKALEGKVVVRLKGGDPYVFGRGGEEGQYLARKGIEVEVVPGITSAIGGLAYAGIPITHRDYASSFHVITGHLKDERDELDWEVLSKLKGTLVFLMGMNNLKNIVSNLTCNGMSERTPVAIVNWATTSKQKVVVATLKDICKVAHEEGMSSPGLIAVGDVVKLRGNLNFFEDKKLFGKKVLVTRARRQSSKLADLIYKHGGMPIEFPVIRVEDLSDADTVSKEIAKVHEYSYVVFTSQNGVRIFFKRLLALGLDSRRLSKAKIVAIGNATAEELKKFNIIADIVPNEYVAEGILSELKGELTSADKILIPRAKESRNLLVEELQKSCFVREVKLYETVLGEGEKSKGEVEKLLKNGEIDYITFTSSSTVKNLVKIITDVELLNRAKLVSIGPVTSKTMEEIGLKVYGQAEKYDIDGILKVLLEDEG